MKVSLPFCILLLVLLSFKATANWGCNTGDYIYPNAAGTDNPNGDPYYLPINPITIRTWDQDPRCGIRNNKIYQRTSGDDNCQIVGGNWGAIWYYNPADNNCVTLPLPLDDYMPLIVVVTAILGAYYIKTRGFRKLTV